MEESANQQPNGYFPYLSSHTGAFIFLFVKVKAMAEKSIFSVFLLFFLIGFLPHDSTHISSQIPSAGSAGQILLRV